MKRKMNNMPISRRLLVAFGIILVMFLCTVVLSVFSLFSTGGNFDNFYTGPYVINDKAAELRNDIQTVAKYIGYSMMEEDTAKTKEYIEEAQTKLQELRDETAFMKEHLEDDTLINQYDAAMQAIKEDRDKVLDMALNNQNTEAADLYFAEVMPGLIEASSYLDQISDMAKDDATGNYNTAKTQKNIVTIVLLVMSAVTFLVTIGLAQYIIKSITAPI